MIRSVIARNVLGIPRLASSTYRRTYCSNSTICWSCSKTLVKENTFFCAACGSLQKVEDVDYFKLLDVSSKFELDASQLTSNFRRLQSVLHPDKFSQKSVEEKNNSLAWSSLVNKAYKTLNVPIERGKYILKRSGIQIAEENTSVDPEFLMDMMERNEQVEEAVEPDELTSLAQSLKVDIDELYVELNAYFRENNLEKAKMTLVRLKYLLNIENIVKEKLLRHKIK